MNNIQGIKTASLLFPKGYSGIDVVYVPIYGKISWLDRRIVPFDLYFSAGLGKTLTNYDGQVSSTFHLATGQIFAINKSWAFRWDFSLNNYIAKGRAITNDNTIGEEVSQAVNDLYLNIGISWFFPGAKYR
jgi:outer membrane beta-barrel protein